MTSSKQNAFVEIHRVKDRIFPTPGDFLIIAYPVLRPVFPVLYFWVLPKGGLGRL